MRLPLDNLRSPAAVARFVLATVLGLAADLYTKYWAFHRLPLGPVRSVGGRFMVQSEEYQFLPNWLHFEVTVNQGAVFGMAQGQRPLFIIVSILAIAFLTYLFATSGRQRFYQIVLGVLLAGVLGNMYDRVRYGYVRDMIHMLPGWKNPLVKMFPGWIELFPWIFNVADTLLCVGVGVVIVYGLFSRSKPETDGVPATDA